MKTELFFNCCYPDSLFYNAKVGRLFKVAINFIGKSCFWQSFLDASQKKEEGKWPSSCQFSIS